MGSSSEQFIEEQIRQQEAERDFFDHEKDEIREKLEGIEEVLKSVVGEPRITPDMDAYSVGYPKRIENAFGGIAKDLTRDINQLLAQHPENAELKDVGQKLKSLLDMGKEGKFQKIRKAMESVNKLIGEDMVLEQDGTPEEEVEGLRILLSRELDEAKMKLDILWDTVFDLRQNLEEIREVNDYMVLAEGEDDGLLEYNTEIVRELKKIKDWIAETIKLLADKKAFVSAIADNANDANYHSGFGEFTHDEIVRSLDRNYNYFTRVDNYILRNEEFIKRELRRLRTKWVETLELKKKISLAVESEVVPPQDVLATNDPWVAKYVKALGGGPEVSKAQIAKCIQKSTEIVRRMCKGLTPVAGYRVDQDGNRIPVKGVRYDCTEVAMLLANKRKGN